MEPVVFPEFSGGEMPSSWGDKSWASTDHRSGPVEPGDYQFWCGCYHNSKGNLYTATKRLAFSWTDGTDEPCFAWIVELHDGRFACVEGGHDYTGWDCQSSLEVCAVEATETEAAKFLTDDPRREYAEKVSP
jgi:hypothetical protein